LKKDEDLAAQIEPAAGEADMRAFLERWLSQPLFSTLGRQAAQVE
jgi:hypothetical protein